MTSDSNRPDGLTVEETQWYDGWRQLVDRYGRNVPHPAVVYGDPQSRTGCLAVMDGHVFTVTPVCDEDGEALAFDSNLQSDLRHHSLSDVMETWRIPRD